MIGELTFIVYIENVIAKISKNVSKAEHSPTFETF